MNKGMEIYHPERYQADFSNHSTKTQKEKIPEGCYYLTMLGSCRKLLISLTVALHSINSRHVTYMIAINYER